MYANDEHQNTKFLFSVKIHTHIVSHPHPNILTNKKLYSTLLLGSKETKHAKKLR